VNTVRKNVKRTDIGHLPEVLRLAEEVQDSKEPQILHHGSEDIALLTPMEAQVPTRRPAKRRGAGARLKRSVLNLIGIADEGTPPDDATDVSSNKHKYLADAHYAEARQPSER
jgi:hypothetical protein